MTTSSAATRKGNVLVVAAHPDDEVLGCGGTLARMALEGHAVHIVLLADGESSRATDVQEMRASGKMEARSAAASAAGKILGSASVEVLTLPDNRLDRIDLLDIVRIIETYVERYRPSTVLTHHGGDVNVDHRIVHDAVLAACRPLPLHPVSELLFFEVPSSTEWQPNGSREPFTPNWFVDVSTTLEVKMQALEAYATELRPYPHPRSAKAVRALAQWRGASAGVEAAEAFVLGRKIVKYAT